MDAPSPSPRRLLQRLVEVADQVVGVLDPDREAHRVVGRPGQRALLVGELAVGGRGRVEDQRAGVAEVGHMAEQIDRIDQPDAGVVAALELEGEQRPGPLGAHLAPAPVPGRALQPEIGRAHV